MIGFLAQTIAAIGAALNGMTPALISPTHCGTSGPIEYCYHAGHPQSDRVIYYLHGFGDDVRSWTVNHTTREVEQEWKKSNTLRPHIVTLSQKVWWYTKKEQGDQLTRFVQQWESKNLSRAPHRLLYGESMGGHNALRWSMDHPEFFDKLVLLCPALPRSFVKSPISHEGFPAWSGLAEQLIQHYYGKDKNHPLAALEKNPETPLPSDIYLMMSPSDDFGFYSGAFKLAELLASASLHTEEQDVKHCKMSAQSLAPFLVN